MLTADITHGERIEKRIEEFKSDIGKRLNLNYNAEWNAL
jgi:hypothetical protein